MSVPASSINGEAHRAEEGALGHDGRPPPARRAELLRGMITDGHLGEEQVDHRRVRRVALRPRICHIIEGHADSMLGHIGPSGVEYVPL